MKKEHLILFLILLLGFILRVYKLGEIPSFQEDEADLGYNAYSVLKTGMDSTGKPFPLLTTSLGDSRPALYIYFAVPFIKFLGLNELAVRLPGVILSTLSVFVFYFLIKELFNKKRFAILSGFFLSISYWHIILSREVSEKTTSAFLVLTGLYFLVRYFNDRRILKLFISLGFLLLSIYTYYAPRIFLPFFLPALFFLYKNKLSSKQRKLLMFIMPIFIIFIIYITLFLGKGGIRVGQLSIFNHPEARALVNEQLAEGGSKANYFVARFFHNKPLYFSLIFLRNYLWHFSPDFIFLNGGEPLRYKVPYVGITNLFELPLFFSGIFFLLLKVKKREWQYFLPFFWLLIGFLPGALAFDQLPNMHRTIMAIFALVLITAYGTDKFLEMIVNFKLKVAMIVVFSVLYIGHFSFFLHQYFVHFGKHKPWYRNYVHKQLALYLSKHKEQYKQIYLTTVGIGTNHILPFYFQYSPKTYQRNWKRKKQFQDLYNISFVNQNCPYPEIIGMKKYLQSNKSLYIDRADCTIKSKQVREIKIIKWADGLPAYQILQPI